MAIENVVQGFAVLTLVWLTISFRRHRVGAPLVVAVLGCLNIAYHVYWEPYLLAFWGGVAGLIVAAAGDYLSITRGRRP